jgi:hypothetical protein
MKTYQGLKTRTQTRLEPLPSSFSLFSCSHLPLLSSPASRGFVAIGMMGVGVGDRSSTSRRCQGTRSLIASVNDGLVIKKRRI